MNGEFSAESFIKIALSGTGALGVLAMIVSWLNKDRDKLVAALNQEREARIKVLEEAARRCAEDRLEMHREMSGLQAEVRELYRKIAEVMAGTDEDSPMTKTARVRLAAPISK